MRSLTDWVAVVLRSTPCHLPGWLAAPPDPRGNPDEVDSIHTPTVAELIDPAAYVFEPVELDGETFHNATIRWNDVDHVFGLTTDLLIEALQWGLEVDSRPGRDRGDSLRAWLRTQERGRGAG